MTTWELYVKDMAWNKPSKKELKKEDLFIIKSDKKNRGKLKIGIGHQQFKDQCGAIRGVCLSAGKSYSEQTIQNLYSLELNCGVNPVKRNTKID